MSCCSEAGLMPLELAVQRLLDAAQSPPEVERVALSQARGRVLAESVHSTVNVPSADNSAMDGFAVAASDWANGTESGIEISQRIPAGAAPEPLEPGTVARIFTGAQMPSNADSVVMQEDCTLLENGRVVLPPTVKPGAHIRRVGEDIKVNGEVLTQGMRLSPEGIALLASVGIVEVPVYRRLKVALLFSGDELLEPGDKLQPGKIYNSNRFLLVGCMEQFGFEVVCAENVPDTLESTITALQSVVSLADVVVTTGGVSVGEEDYLKPAVEKLGAIDFWKVNIKPGKPFASGYIKADGRSTPFIGLPGNPVSVYATLLLLGVPFLKTLQGEVWSKPAPSQLPIGFDVKRAGRRDEYVRVRLSAEGVLEKYSNQSSGVLSSTVWCDGFALLKAGESYNTGDRIDFFWISQLRD